MRESDAKALATITGVVGIILGAFVGGFMASSSPVNAQGNAAYAAQMQYSQCLADSIDTATAFGGTEQREYTPAALLVLLGQQRTTCSEQFISITKSI